MMREPESFDKLRVSVYLKNGDSYCQADTTPTPFGQDASLRVITIWVDGVLKVFPLENVEYMEFHFDE